MSETGYEIIPFSRSRQIIAESLRVAERKHIIHGLLDVDVTDARRFVREYEARTGEQLSFTAFIIVCLSKAVSEDKMVQAFRLGSRKLIVFDDVDVSTMVERTTVEGEKVVRVHVIRSVDKRIYQDINREIQEVQSRPADKVMPQETKVLTDIGFMLPGFLRQFFMRFLFGNPHRVQHFAGTVAVTAVGMFGDGGGWGIPTAGPLTLLTLGGITEKPGIVDGRIEPREYLSLTISFDHDIVDGAPAARFASRLKQLIECGYGLG
ncbi:MAG: 2-oxo acid dehydrogenase subunit E2 [Chloroflexi bacterium]|nr:2-oxo acid dehydrogenase subunit E2 [Chloroflexota bacterium]